MSAPLDLDALRLLAEEEQRAFRVRNEAIARSTETLLDADYSALGEAALEWLKADAALHKAVSPDVVLALIAEAEDLRLHTTAKEQLLQDDLYRVVRALDIPARPYSGHEAMERDILPKIEALIAEAAAARRYREEAERLRESIDRPETIDFLTGVQREAAHQEQRWGAEHDRTKAAEDWFWLVGYLAGKALRAALEGDDEKARHHAISTAAACAQWHRHMLARAALAAPARQEDE